MVKTDGMLNSIDCLAGELKGPTFLFETSALFLHVNLFVLMYLIQLTIYKYIHT